MRISREEIYRGRKKGNKDEWVTGTLMNGMATGQLVCIIPEGSGSYGGVEIDGDTLQKYAYFYDDGDQRVFEGDAVKLTLATEDGTSYEMEYDVLYSDATVGIGLRDKEGKYFHLSLLHSATKVELIKKEDDSEAGSLLTKLNSLLDEAILGFENADGKLTDLKLN